jgi:hypothetical protein
LLWPDENPQRLAGSTPASNTGSQTAAVQLRLASWLHLLTIDFGCAPSNGFGRRLDVIE